MSNKAPTPKNDDLDFENLDLLLTSRSLAPIKVRMFAQDWTARRDFTAEQLVEFWGLIDSGKTEKAMCMLVGEKDGPVFTSCLAKMPAELMQAPLRKLYTLAGLLKRDDREGEASAS